MWNHLYCICYRIIQYYKEWYPIVPIPDQIQHTLPYHKRLLRNSQGHPIICVICGQREEHSLLIPEDLPLYIHSRPGESACQLRATAQRNQKKPYAESQVASTVDHTRKNAHGENYWITKSLERLYGYKPCTSFIRATIDFTPNWSESIQHRVSLPSGSSANGLVTKCKSSNW